MKFESKLCLWCWQSVPFDPARIVSDRYGTAVLRGKDGRMHSFRSKLKENELEQETEQTRAPGGTRGGEAITEDSETEALIKFSEAFGE
ncbi:MAG TPA: hypothetical protein VN939_06015 [Chthoniobacterales bacterium]|jgi:hypothetical protein|nr:hypothetical protein [Chthoniobacterales bacterium]